MRVEMWVKCPKPANGRLGGVYCSKMPEQRSNLDRNVSQSWKPVAGLEIRKPGIGVSDRIWYWLVSLGGIALAAVGIALVAYTGMGKWGGLLIGVGLVVFALSPPTQAARKGYRSS